MDEPSIRTLLWQYGIVSRVIDDGVLCLQRKTKTKEALRFVLDATTWQWLEPLLEELVAFRQKEVTHRRKASQRKRNLKLEAIIVSAYEGGESYSSIARQLGLSGERARQIYIRYRRELGRPPS